MSVPRSLRLPDGTRPTTLPSPYGPVAALRLDPRAESRGTVLLVPGFTGSKEDFLGLLAPIAESGYAVVAVDQRGQYETVGVEDVTPDGYSLEVFTDEALAILDAIGEPVHLVGHSFGGLVAQSLTLSAPDRVRSLSLLGTGPGALPQEHHDILGTFIAGLPLVGKETAWKVLRERDAASVATTSPEVEDFLRRRFVASSAGSLVGIARILVSAPDRIDELAALEVPIQVAFGVDDDTWPPALQTATAARLSAPVHAVEDATHSLNVDQPGTTAAILTAFFSAAGTV